PSIRCPGASRWGGRAPAGSTASARGALSSIHWLWAPSFRGTPQKSGRPPRRASGGSPRTGHDAPEQELGHRVVLLPGRTLTWPATWHASVAPVRVSMARRAVAG